MSGPASLSDCWRPAGAAHSHEIGNTARAAPQMIRHADRSLSGYLTLVLGLDPGQDRVQVPGQKLPKRLLTRVIGVALTWLAHRAPCREWLKRGLPTARSSGAFPHGHHPAQNSDRPRATPNRLTSDFDIRSLRGGHTIRHNSQIRPRGVFQTSPHTVTSMLRDGQAEHVLGQSLRGETELGCYLADRQPLTHATQSAPCLEPVTIRG